jgi:hypothetical protein
MTTPILRIVEPQDYNPDIIFNNQVFSSIDDIYLSKYLGLKIRGYLDNGYVQNFFMAWVAVPPHCSLWTESFMVACRALNPRSEGKIFGEGYKIFYVRDEDINKGGFDLYATLNITGGKSIIEYTNETDQTQWLFTPLQEIVSGQKIYDNAKPSQEEGVHRLFVESLDLEWKNKSEAKEIIKKTTKTKEVSQDIGFGEMVDLGKYYYDSISVLDTIQSDTYVYHGSLLNLFNGWKDYLTTDQEITYEAFLAKPTVCANGKDITKIAIETVHDNFDKIWALLSVSGVTRLEFVITSEANLGGATLKQEFDIIVNANASSTEDNQIINIEIQTALESVGGAEIYFGNLNGFNLNKIVASSTFVVTGITSSRLRSVFDSGATHFGIYLSKNPTFASLIPGTIGNGEFHVYEVTGSTTHEIDIAGANYSHLKQLFPNIDSKTWNKNTFDNIFYFNLLRTHRLENDVQDENYLRKRLAVISPRDYCDEIFNLTLVDGGDKDIPNHLAGLLGSVYTCKNLTKEFGDESVSRYMYCIYYFQKEHIYPYYCYAQKEAVFDTEVPYTKVAVPLNAQALWNVKPGYLYLGLVKLEENPYLKFTEINDTNTRFFIKDTTNPQSNTYGWESE